MSNNRIALLSIVGLGVVFQALFYNHGMGLNTLVFTLIITAFIFLFKKQPNSKVSIVLLLGFYAATLGVILGHTAYSLVIYWLSFFLLLGSIVIPGIRYMHFAPAFALNAIGRIQSVFVRLSQQPDKNNRGSRLGVWMRFVFLPVVLFGILLALYAASNTYFNDSIRSILQYLSNMFEHVSLGRMLFGIIGLLIGSYFLISELRPSLLNRHLTTNTQLLRLRKRNRLPRGLTKGLIRKQQVAIVFFVLINLMAAWLNILDIKHVWLGFTWDGGYLKEMVHEGTYVLIFAILISMGIALYYLNGNLVFLKNHKLFQTLITIWLAQNMLMVISVVSRNCYYVEYFGLAYKRIFVYFFLAACIVGLLSIIYKSLKYKSATYLFAVNTMSIYICCVTAGLFNWDAIIARYNFDHYQSSFVHYDFLVNLNNASLPYIITNDVRLKEIDKVQTEKFSFSSRESYKEIGFRERIEERRKYFKETWEESNWLDWNLPEKKAYVLLKE
ncbi:MAG: DUF4173 domain-containing protein [Bacteroidota bacterium]